MFQLLFTFIQIKAGIVERVNRSLQSLIYKYMTHNETRTWIYALDALVESYNKRPHRSIDHLSPDEVCTLQYRYNIDHHIDATTFQAELDINKNRVATALRKHYNKAIEAPGTEPKFKVGNIVRLKNNFGNRFARGYEEQFTQELFKIIRVIRSTPETRGMGRTMYEIKSEDTGEIIAGKCYANELQKVTTDVLRFNVIDHGYDAHGQPIMKISWKGYGPHHDQWVPENMPITADFQSRQHRERQNRRQKRRGHGEQEQQQQQQQGQGITTGVKRKLSADDKVHGLKARRSQDQQQSQDRGIICGVKRKLSTDDKVHDPTNQPKVKKVRWSDQHQKQSQGRGTMLPNRRRSRGI